jgi:hypothetical protein
MFDFMWNMIYFRYFNTYSKWTILYMW